MVFIQEKKLLILKDGAYVTNLDDYKSIGAHWIALYVNGAKITYFIYRIQANDWILLYRIY